ncbi:MAG: twin-arginine translocase TatA/TatE family subunit [Rhodobiaceae bacterium]|jgi:sec-independent protein translocase protein TatA|nr:sec-independent protein translocase protein TatA [Rhodobiaceae bacterium]MCR9240906.1 twin-arginine translocase TatA/TatE family subunit [Rhodobiaceae bacterium]
MGQIGPWQIIIVLVLVVLLFGRGKISELMGDVAKGIKSFRSGLSDDEQAAAEQADPKTINAQQSETTTKDKTAAN